MAGSGAGDDLQDFGTYDFIVVGAGSAAACWPTASRRSPPARAGAGGGGRDNWIWFHIPAGYLFAIGNKRADWLFTTRPRRVERAPARLSPRQGHRRLVRHQRDDLHARPGRDYDGWRQLGPRRLGLGRRAAYFLKHEDHIAPPNDFHRSGGEWRVEPPRIRWAILDAIRDAAEAAGIPKIRISTPATTRARRISRSTSAAAGAGARPAAS